MRSFIKENFSENRKGKTGTATTEKMTSDDLIVGTEEHSLKMAVEKGNYAGLTQFH